MGLALLGRLSILSVNCCLLDKIMGDWGEEDYRDPLTGIRYANLTEAREARNAHQDRALSEERDSERLSQQSKSSHHSSIKEWDVFMDDLISLKGFTFVAAFLIIPSIFHGLIATILLTKIYWLVSGVLFCFIFRRSLLGVLLKIILPLTVLIALLYGLLLFLCQPGHHTSQYSSSTVKHHQ